jgi:hypothetical protein
MIRSIIPLLTSLLIAPQAHTQPYQLTTFTETFTYLTGDSLLSENIAWFNQQWTLPIGFPFQYMGKTYVEYTQWNEGVYFGLEDAETGILPFEAFLQDKSFNTPGPGFPESPLSILRTGQPGNRILKIQARNCGFMEGTIADSVTLQIWLYETDHAIEIRFGPHQILSDVWQDGTTGPFIGLSFNDGSDFLLAGGNPANPFLYLGLDENDPLFPLEGPPPVNTVYRFVPVVNPTIEPGNPTTFLGPNPVSGNLLTTTKPLFEEGVTIHFFTTEGRLALSTQIRQQTMEIDRLPPGIYFLTAPQLDGKIIRQKIVRR